MILGKKVLAIIPARGGSKGIPRKNICDLGGKPLIAWTIEAAKQSKYIDRVILSSEDAEIISVAKAYGCDVPFVRPIELAQDDTAGIDPVLHALQMVKGYDLIVLLQVTSPLRISSDIDACIELLVKTAGKSCVSLAPVQESPYWMYTLDGESKMSSLLEKADSSRRQDLPKVYILNGSVYVAEHDWLLKTKSFISEETLGHIMPIERSIDIDSMADLKTAEYILENIEKQQ